MKYYKLGYVASPLNAPTKAGINHNMKMARRYEAVLNMITKSRNRAVQGYMPIILDDNIPSERNLALEMGQKMLVQSDAIILCGTRLSQGMAAELKTAIENDIVVFVLEGIPSRFKAVNRYLINTGKVSLSPRTASEVKMMLTRRVIA